LQSDLPNYNRFEGLGTNLGKHSLPRCDNLVEQREHRSMTPGVVDVHECRGTVMQTQNVKPKLVGSIEVVGQLVSRRNHYA
jgi:hypothetical protein